MILPYSSIEGLTIQQACSTVTAAKKKRIGDAKLFDFIIQDDSELPGIHGIYFFLMPTAQLASTSARIHLSNT